MPQYRAVAPVPATSSNSSGNATAVDTKATITANLTTADEVILGELPSGFRLQQFMYRNTDLDTGTTLAFNVGYRSVHPDQTVAASPTFFLSASTAGQAAQANWVNVPFEPITFQEPVQIVLKPTANAAGLPGGAGTIWSLFEGVVAGVN